MMIEDNDIDESVWIPEGEPVMTPERFKHGNFKVDLQCQHCGGHGKIVTEVCHACDGKGRKRNDAPDLDQLSEICYAQEIVTNMLNFMFWNDIITEQNAQDGKTYQIWQIVFRVTNGLGYVQNSIYRKLTSELDASGVKINEFSKAIKLLGAKNCKNIEWAIDSPQSDYNRFLAKQYSRQYAHTFNRLTEVMESLNPGREKR